MGTVCSTMGATGGGLGEEIWEFLLDRTEDRESEDWWPDGDERRSQDSAAQGRWSRYNQGRGEHGWSKTSWWRHGHDQSRGQWLGTTKEEEDPWAAAAAKRRRSSGMFELGSGAGEHSDKPTEKIPVPSFAGHAGEEGEIGSAARSYLRKVEGLGEGHKASRTPPRRGFIFCLEGTSLGGGRSLGPGQAQLDGWAWRTSRPGSVRGSWT